MINCLFAQIIYLADIVSSCPLNPKAHVFSVFTHLSFALKWRKLYCADNDIILNIISNDFVEILKWKIKEFNWNIRNMHVEIRPTVSYCTKNAN